MSSRSSSSSSNVMATNFTSLERAVAVVVILMGCTLCLQQHGALAAPSVLAFLQPGDKAPTGFSEDNACYHDAETEELCQHCAKMTKSVKVYPMCCGDLEEARAWCKAYVDFGKIPS